jgi:methyltransferase (TIGR00027 family)
MKKEQSSSTALLIAASLVLMHNNPEYEGLVSAKTAKLCTGFLDSSSRTWRWLLALTGRRWFHRTALLVERLTIPGILRHYALRKKCLGRLVRDALENGIAQIVVLGAGFDPLALELQQEFRAARFWEIDHPETQRNKRRGAGEIDAKRFTFIAADLCADQIGSVNLAGSGFDPRQRSCWVAEGLLMYFARDVVANLLNAAAKLSARGSRFAFTFMEPAQNGQIRFRGQTKLVDWWLHWRGEPFAWGIQRDQVREFAQPWQVVRIFDDVDLRTFDSRKSHFPLAAGELICLTEIL